jgi:trk system potassium uptake protein TrkH
MEKLDNGMGHKLTYTRIIAFGFLSVILIGTFLLSLPVSSRDREWTPVIDALFTATSATCLRLVVYVTF